MHFHLPRPLHGWREFAGEVGIIVIGVLIALCAEQLVEALQWHEKVEVVRQSLVGELSNDRARWDHDLAAARCVSHEVSGLRLWANGNVQRLPSVPVMKSSYLYALHTTNWTLAASSQTLDHFSIRDQLAFASLYSAILGRQTELLKVSDLLGQLHTLIPLASHPEERLKLQEALGELDANISSVLDDVGYMQLHFDAVGVRPDRTDLRADPMSAELEKQFAMHLCPSSDR